MSAGSLKLCRLVLCFRSAKMEQRAEFVGSELKFWGAVVL